MSLMTGLGVTHVLLCHLDCCIRTELRLSKIVLLIKTFVCTERCEENEAWNVASLGCSMDWGHAIFCHHVRIT